MTDNPRVVREVAVSYLCQGWSSVVAIAFLPLLARYLGAEYYAVIGIYSLLQSSVGLFDLGATPAINRQVALLSAGVLDRRRFHRFVGVVVLCAIGFSVVFIGAAHKYSGVVVTHWLKAQAIGDAQLTWYVTAICVLMPFRWGEQFCRSLLFGANDFYWANILVALSATARWVGGAAVLLIAHRSLDEFFEWQMMISIAGLASLLLRAVVVVKRVSVQKRVGVQGKPIGIRSFALKMFAVSLLSLALMQGDKVVLSGLVSLRDFGVYALASNIALGLMQMAVPLNNWLLPRMTREVATGDKNGLYQSYVLGSLVLGVALAPVLVSFVVCPQLTMFAWTGNLEAARDVVLPLTVLAIGTAFNIAVNPCYVLQVASGWTTFLLFKNVAALVILAVGLTVLVPRVGTMGAAIAWLIVNLFYISVEPMVVHRRTFGADAGLGRWYALTVGVSSIGVGCSLPISLLFRSMEPDRLHAGLGVAYASAAALVASSVVALAIARGVMNDRRLQGALVRGNDSGQVGSSCGT